MSAKNAVSDLSASFSFHLGQLKPEYAATHRAVMFPIGRPVRGQLLIKLNEENTKTRVLTCIQRRDGSCRLHLQCVNVVRSLWAVHRPPFDARPGGDVPADRCQAEAYLLPAGRRCCISARRRERICKHLVSTMGEPA